MGIRVERRSGGDERRILIGMVMDPSVLGRIAPRWQPAGLFASKWANIVGGWAVKYHREYSQAPGRAITGLFEAWAADNDDADTVGLLEKFLTSLSDEYEATDLNVPYLIDLAGKHFNRVATRKFIDKLQGSLDSGDDAETEAAKLITNWSRIELGGGEGVDLFKDDAVLQSMFSDREESLIQYPGAAGEFFGDSLCRDGFVAFMGPEKRGKTWWLLDLAFRGVMQRRKVAFFEVGDMSLNQIGRRFAIRAAKHPRKAGTYKVPLTCERLDDVYPSDDEAGGKKGEVLIPLITYEDRVFEEGLSYPAAKAAFHDLMERKAKSREQLLRLSVHSNSSISAAGIRAVLAEWERGGWAADVVVIDYADILAPPAGQMESRDAVNATWKQLRAISQDRHCLVVTATQADAASYGLATIGKANFSEDKRKLAHVTGMLGINDTDAEKAAGVQRLNWLVLREAEYSSARCVFTAGCVALGNPCIKSAF